MALSNLEQKLAVNPFGKIIEVDRRPEVIKHVDFVMDEAISRELEHYKNMKKEKNLNLGQLIELVKPNLELLTPNQIQELLGIIITNKMPITYPVTSIYAAELIGKSYNSGYNDFTLNLFDSELNMIFLKGENTRPIHVLIKGDAYQKFGGYSKDCIFDIYGNTGNSCGDDTKFCTFNIKGNAGDECGTDSENNYYNIMGNVGDLLGYRSKDSKYHITGNVGKYCGSAAIDCEFVIEGDVKRDIAMNATKCVFTIYGQIEDKYNPFWNFLNTEHCAFKVTNQDVYNNLTKRLIPNNLIQLIDNTGKIVKEIVK